MPVTETKTAEAIAVLRNDIRRVEISLRGEIGQLREDLHRQDDAAAGVREGLRLVVERLAAIEAALEAALARPGPSDRSV